MEIPVAPSHQPKGNAWVRIWGLSIKDLTGAFNLNPTPQNGQKGALVAVYGGMSKGLPLANPAQARLLVKGQVIQCYGNWLGTAQTVDLILQPGGQGSSTEPVNYSIDWRAGTTMADAISATLATALPAAKQSIKISPRLTQSYDQAGYYASLAQLNMVLNPLSKTIITDIGYPGVTMSYDGETVTVQDGSAAPSSTVTIAYQDLIGQPTYIGPLTIQIKTVMRGDIEIGTKVILPAGLVTSSASAFQGLSGTNPANNLTFSGPYPVQSIHHFGNFRQPDASSWCTVIEMLVSPDSTAGDEGAAP